MTKPTDSPRRRVLITDGEERAALAACRALRSTGYAVDAVASRGPAAVHWSRYCSRRLWAPDPRADRAAFADSLSELLARRRYDLLLPASDAALLAISEDRDRLSQLVTIGLPGQEAVLRCLSKVAAVEDSGATQLAAPRTEVCRTLDETREAATEIGFPLLVKPQMSARPEGMGLRERSSRRVSSESELAATTEDFGMPVLVQRCLRGPVHSLGGVITDQGLVAAAYSRYVRTWPPDAGNVSCSVSLPLPAQLREAAATLLDRIGWRGIFELELMEKPDGNLGLIDLNPRVYGSLELAVHAGASLPAIWCDSLLEDPVVSELRDARVGVWYRWEDADVRYALRRLRSGGMRDVAPVLRPRRGTAHALFRLSDPGPLFARVISAVRGRRQSRQQNHQPHPVAEHKTPTRGVRVSLDAEVAVIGAGPYGLACTRFLKKAGVDVLTFGEKMRFWQERMPEQMILRSRRRSSHIADPDGSLSLDAFAAEHGHPRLDPVPLTEFQRYGAWYGERAVPDLDGRRIIAVVPRGERSFTLRLEDGAEPTVSRVIVAAGISPFAWRDSPLAELSDELVSHSSYHRNFGRFRGRSVVVVGCGQSALESAALLHEAGAAVELIARRPAPVWLGGDADSLRARVRARMVPPTDVGGRVSGWLAAAPGVMRVSPRALREWTTARCIVPAGAEWLPERVRDVTMTMDCQIRAAEARDGTVWISLDDGSERKVDHAILATGWRIDVARYPFLDRSIVERLELRNGYPVLGPGLESSVPGLHFVGTAAAMSFGPINRFVVGSWYTAPVIARAASGKRQRPLRLSYRPRRGPLTVN